MKEKCGSAHCAKIVADGRICAQVSFVNGVATFNLESLKVKNEIVTKLITHLTDIKKEILNKKDILDYSLLPAGKASIHPPYSMLHYHCMPDWGGLQQSRAL